MHTYEEYKKCVVCNVYSQLYIIHIIIRIGTDEKFNVKNETKSVEALLLLLYELVVEYEILCIKKIEPHLFVRRHRTCLVI